MSQEIEKCEQGLMRAKERLTKAGAALSAKHVGGEWEAFEAASDEVLLCERQLAASKGESYAELLDFPAQWDVGAPMPHLFKNDYKAYLIFYLAAYDPDWDGSYVNVVDPNDDKPASLALVEFNGCAVAQLGVPNEDFFDNHPLSGKGLEGYTPHHVINSAWIEQLKIFHRQSDPILQRSKHYLFGFHDTSFECVAESHNVELFNTSLKELMAIVCQRMIE